VNIKTYIKDKKIEINKNSNIKLKNITQEFFEESNDNPQSYIYIHTTIMNHDE
jgi:hypothetical protein